MGICMMDVYEECVWGICTRDVYEECVCVVVFAYDLYNCFD